MNTSNQKKSIRSKLLIILTITYYILSTLTFLLFGMRSIETGNPLPFLFALLIVILLSWAYGELYNYITLDYYSTILE